MVTFQGKQFDNWQQARASMATRVEAAPPVDDSPTVSAPTIELPKIQARQALTEKYRPRNLAEVRGQDHAVSILAAFSKKPYPAAFIFSGETGTGKTSAAWALAAEIGCNIDSTPHEFGGVYSIASGEHNAESLREVWDRLWEIPFESRDGWKVLIVNEVEQLTGTVEKLWLDKLEDLPPKTAIVFTTNNIGSLPERFVDRCIGGVIEFAASADDLTQSARQLAASVWRSETGEDIPDDVLAGIVAKSTKAGRISFRRIVQNIVPILAQRQ